MKALTYFCMCLFVLLCFASSTLTHAQTADTIYHNGRILTMAGTQPVYAEALAVNDGKIVFVGEKAVALRMKGNATKVVDLEGKALLPGFVDAHSHYINSLLVANQCQLYAPPSGVGKDVPSIIAELKRYAEERKIPKGELVMGYGYDDTVMPDGRLLNRGDLDEAFPDNPVRVDHVSMHGGVLNSLALKKYGISADTKTPPGGVIVRKPGSEEPWGLIMETAFLPVFEQSEPMTAQQEIDATRAGQLLYARAGITTAHEGATHYAQLQTMKRASDVGANMIDIVAFPFITDLEKIVGEYPAQEWLKYHNRLKLGGVKITMDGSPQGRTAFFTSPYLTGGPSGEKDWRGELSFPQDLANKMVKQVYDLNLPLNLHCNGDAAIDAFFTAYEFARGGDYSKPWNVTTIHNQFLRKDQIGKFVKYKVRPSLYTLHTYYFAEAHIANRGSEQAMYISPMRDVIDAGLHPSNHTDFVVAPLDQMMMLHSAVNRVSRKGAVIGKGQQVTPFEGLKAMTIWVAEQYGEQDTKGTLASGKLADLVILDKDPTRVDPLELKNIRVLETIKEGVTIYPANTSTPGITAPSETSKQTYRWRAHICDMAEVNQAVGKDWVLVSLNEQKINVEMPPTLRFEHGRIMLFGGVNRISGSYALIQDSVTLGDLVGTKRAGPPELMELENSLAETLATVNGFHVQGDSMELLSGGKVVAKFQTGK